MGYLVPALALLFLSCLAPTQQQSDEETVSLPLTPPIASAEVVKQNYSTCPSVDVRNVVKNNLRPLILSTTDTVVPCTSRVKGLVPHCPAMNCTEIINLAQEEGLILMSNYYWLEVGTEDVRNIYCNQDTQQPEYSSCEELSELDNLASGTYTIHPSKGSPVSVYCDMDSEGCGGGVWTRVASNNYSDPNTVCPTTWVQMTDPIRGCSGVVDSCSASLFAPLVGFSQVCGKVIAVQNGHPDSFAPPDDIEGYYLDGISVTHGSPRHHIWSFAAYPDDDYSAVASLCPCSQESLNIPPPPSFVGNNYFCDTATEILAVGWHIDDPLWDGQGCPNISTCCSFNNPPWFSTTLPQSTTDGIEVRICGPDDSNIAIVQLDLYVK